MRSFGLVWLRRQTFEGWQSLRPVRHVHVQGQSDACIPAFQCCDHTRKLDRLPSPSHGNSRNSNAFWRRQSMPLHSPCRVHGTCTICSSSAPLPSLVIERYGVQREHARSRRLPRKVAALWRLFGRKKWGPVVTPACRSALRDVNRARSRAERLSERLPRTEEILSLTDRSFRRASVVHAAQAK